MPAERAESGGSSPYEAADEWRRAWPLPFAAGLGFGVAVTHLYTLGLFVEPIERETGWSRSDILSGLSFVSVVVVVLSVWIGMLVDHLGPRRIAIFGICLYGGALASLGVAGDDVRSWWALWLGLGIGAASIQATVWTHAVAARFDRSRGLALSVTLSGAAVSAALTPLLADALIAALGWRKAYPALAGALLAATLPILLIFFRSPSPRTPPLARVTDAEATLRSRLRLTISPCLACMVGISFLLTGSLMALVVHFLPILETSGLDRSAGALAVSTIGIASIVGRLVGGLLLDRINSPIVATGVFLLPMLAVIVLLLAPMSAWTAYAAALLIGLSLGGEVDVLAYMTARYFSLDRFGALFGVINAAGAIGLGVGPAIGGFAYDLQRDYTPMLFGVMATVAAVIALSLTLGRYPDRNAVRSGPDAAS